MNGRFRRDEVLRVLGEAGGADSQLRPTAPALFVSHGAPTVALEDDRYTRLLRRFAASRARPAALVVVSAHWESRPVRVGASEAMATLHDFDGFDPKLRALTYPAPGLLALAKRVRSLLESFGVPSELEAGRGLDHGAWVPLRHLYPEADLPVVPVSLLRGGEPLDALRVGAALAPLREEGAMLLGSGGVVHNLGEVDLADKHAELAPWARAFDGWVEQRLETGDLEGLVHFAQRAPDPARAAPTLEHLLPLFFVLGAAGDDAVVDVFKGIHHGSLSMRCFALTP